MNINIEEFFQKKTLSQFVGDYWGIKEYFTGERFDILKNFITFDYIKEKLENPKFFEQAAVLLRSTDIDDIITPKSLSDVLYGIENGYTLQVRKLQNILPHNSVVMQVLKVFEHTFCQPLDSVTFFYSINHSLPTAIHKDINEIFSFQLSGKKRWVVATEKCLHEQYHFQEGDIVDWREYILEAGNIMYVPAYLPHQVKCIEDSSSLAFAFRTFNRNNILLYLSEDPIIKAELLKPLPILGYESLSEQAKNQIYDLMNILQRRTQEIGAGQILKVFHQQLKDNFITSD